MVARTSTLAHCQDALDAGDFARARLLAEGALAESGTETGTRGKSDPAHAEAKRLLALCLLYGESADDAEQLAQEAIRIARAAGAPKETALAELALAEVLRSRGDYLAGLAHAGRARKLAEKAGDPRTEAAVLSDYALLLSRLGDDERAREAFDRVLEMPLTALPRARALRVIYNAAMAHRAAGRFELALRTLARFEDLPRTPAAPSAEWMLTSAHLRTLADMGCFDEARAVVDGVDESGLDARWQRAQLLAFRAGLMLATGGRIDKVESLIDRGLAIDGLEPPIRFELERVRALALIQKSRFFEAERVAIGLTAGAAKSGTRQHAAQALAIAARAGAPDAWLMRWLGALACATGGTAARIEHEAYAALVNEPEPIGQLARNALVTLRARLVDRTPAVYKKTMLKTLRQVEQRTAILRKTKQEEAQLAIGDEVVQAKEEVGIAGAAPALMRAVSTVARAARSNASLVLTGETGSGKELFARLAHRLSARARAKFVAINCAAIPQPLLEAELFGHERGAFTGAERARPGLFVEAHGGTLLLDEVGEMSPAMQAKLLRVLEDREVRALGGTRSRKVDVRVIAATHRDLTALVGRGDFREDLYYRLAAITVRVPSLRERPEDLHAVARALLARDDATAAYRLDVPALALLTEHTWPGNVRELANVLRVAAAMVEGHVIGAAELSSAIGTSHLPRRAAGDGGGVAAVAGKPAGKESVGAERPAGKESVGAERPAGKEATLAALRARHRAELRELVGRAIAAADGNKQKAARSLGVSRQGLYRVLET